jgi:hypothetical protein
MFSVGRIAMVSVLMVANGTTLLRDGMTALRATGCRVTLYDTTNARDLRRSGPDLLIFAADVPRIAHMLLAQVRNDAVLHDLPVVIVGASTDVFAPLPVSLLTNTIVLPTPPDGVEVRDAVHAFCPAQPLHRLDHSHAVA